MEKRTLFWVLCLRKKNQKDKVPMWKYKIIKHFPVKSRFISQIVCFSRLILQPSEIAQKATYPHLMLYLTELGKQGDGKSSSIEVSMK